MRAFFTTLLVFVALAAAPAPALQAQHRRPGQPGMMPQAGPMGNQDRAYVWGNVVLSPANEGETEIPGQGAVVSIACERRKGKVDTLHAVVNEKGTFIFRNVPVGKALVRFSMLGYEELSNTVDIHPGENKMIANLKPRSFELKDAVLTEKVAPVSINRDTIIFNAAAVKVNKGEKAIDILEQMPGVEVSGSSVSVLGEDVKHVYIDGALLFGSAPMTALNNLDASEVISIKSYQEYANKDPYHKISKNESKQRVMDVVTRSKPKAVKNGNAFAAAGFDTDTTYHKFRYSVGGDMHFFSESLIYGSSLNVNNINDNSNQRRGNSFRTASGGGGADLRAINANASISRKWMSPTVRNFVLGQISASWSFADSYNVNESRGQQIYFPQEGKYNSREVLTESSNTTSNGHHTLNLSGSKSLKDGNISGILSYNHSTSSTTVYRSSYNIQDGGSPQGTVSGTRAGGGSDNMAGNLSFHKGFDNRLRLNLSMDASGSTTGSESVKTDTLSSTETYKVLSMNGSGRGRKLGVYPGVRYEIDDRSSIGLTYSLSDNLNVSDMLALDLTEEDNPFTDLVNSYTYTTSHISQSASLGFNTSLEKMRAILHSSVSYESVGMKRDETFPEESWYDRRFNSVSASLMIARQTMLDNWSLNCRTNATTPYLEQVRPRIDNTNLYSVSAGNPLINQSRTYTADFRYSSPVGREAREQVREMEAAGDGRAHVRGGHGRPRQLDGVSTLSVSAGFNVTTSPIVRRQTYYAQETYLPEYDYTMPAQSTFSTYENAPAQYSANANSSFSTDLDRLRCLFTAGASLNWSSTPSYYDGVLTRTRNINPSLSLRLRTNFSRNVRITLGVTGNYVHSANTEKNTTEYFTERINLGWELNNILDHIYAGGNYFKMFTQGMNYGSFNDNIMNLNAGYRWGPKNDYDICLTVNDMFNSRTGFSTSMKSNYVSNSWTHNFGRYVLLSFSYRFGSMREGRGRG